MAETNITQNIYDNPAFFEAYSHLPRSAAGLSRAPEWPVLKTMLPDVKGLRVLDLGCGYGYFSRWALEQGAKSVLGLDVSEMMLSKARELSSAEGNDRPNGLERSTIEFRRADLETLELEAAAFDVAFSSLTFHYLHDFPRLLATIHKSLTPGARLVFSIEHPIYTSSYTPGWIIDAQGKSKWGVDGYMMEGERVTNWLGEDVVKVHRTLGTTLGNLIDGGWRVVGVRDFGPDEKQVERGETHIEHRERPMFLLVSAVRE